MPDPLEPPVAGAPLPEDESRAARAAIGAAEAGRALDGERWARQLRAGHPVTDLVALELRFLAGESVATPTLALASTHGSYAAAWSLGALAAEREGRLYEAVEAAQTAAALQPAGFAQGLPGRLERVLTESVLRSAGESLRAGRPGEAALAAVAVLELVPSAVPVRTLAVRATLEAGELQRATALVGALPESPEGLELKGRVAAALGQPELAVALLERLPSDYPTRCALLQSARASLRSATAPPSFARAEASGSLQRSQLAAILAWEVPGLEKRAVGPVPVFEDIVDIAERREVLTVVRAGMMNGDPIARRFFPGRGVGATELAATRDRVAVALRRAPLPWCGDTVMEGCVAIPEPVDGSSAVALTRRVAGVEGTPCR